MQRVPAHRRGEAGPRRPIRRHRRSRLRPARDARRPRRQGVDVAALFPELLAAHPVLRSPRPRPRRSRSPARTTAGSPASRRRRAARVCSASPSRPCTIPRASKPRSAAPSSGRRRGRDDPPQPDRRPAAAPSRPRPRFFALLEDLDVPMLLHEGRGGQPTFAGNRFDTWYATHVVSHPFEMMLAVLGLTVEGVFDRHPRLRVGVLEAGTGWLPWWLHRLDEHHELFGPKERPEMATQAERVLPRALRDRLRHRRRVRGRDRRGGRRRPGRVVVRLPAPRSDVPRRRRAVPPTADSAPTTLAACSGERRAGSTGGDRLPNRSPNRPTDPLSNRPNRRRQRDGDSSRPSHPAPADGGGVPNARVAGLRRQARRTPQRPRPRRRHAHRAARRRVLGRDPPQRLRPHRSRRPHRRR